MLEVDKKILKYVETKRIALGLRKEVEQLQALIKNLEDAINDENKKTMNLSNEVIASIKVSDLIEKLANLLNVSPKDVQIKIIVISGTYAKTLKELSGYKTDDAKDLNSYLSVRLKDGTHICSKDLRLFNDLNEIQTDGYTLLRHCRLERRNFERSDLVVDKNVSGIICNFRVDAVDLDNYDSKEIVLPMAIRECIKDEEIKEQNKIKRHTLVKK